MSSAHQVVHYEGLPVGLIQLNAFYPDFDFKQGFKFIEAMIEKKHGKEIEACMWNNMITHAIVVSATKSQCSTCWLAAKFLHELWKLNFNTKSPWHDFLVNQLKMKKLNSHDDLMIYGSYLSGNLFEDTNLKQRIHQFFDTKFPMAW
ncbi:hypothetical protein F4776DRAFT_662102 [Hypoxylon sp. NC0597]|nr:hypothetical protein F4776DRAFT_662102 [Hypoxylon sp. NC0597]